MKPGSARLPVLAIRLSRPSRSSISAHSAPVRWSFQRIAGRSTCSLLVEHDEPVHLAGEADRGRLDGERRERGLGGAPPVLGILLGPAGPRRREPVAALGPRDDLPGGRDRERLDGARADVEADEDAVARHEQKSAATAV